MVKCFTPMRGLQSRSNPKDINDWRTAPSVPGFTYRAGPRSVVILFADLRDGTSPGLPEPTMLDRTAAR